MALSLLRTVGSAMQSVPLCMEIKRETLCSEIGKFGKSTALCCMHAQMDGEKIFIIIPVGARVRMHAQKSQPTHILEAGEKANNSTRGKRKTVYVRFSV